MHQQVTKTMNFQNSARVIGLKLKERLPTQHAAKTKEYTVQTYGRHPEICNSSKLIYPCELRSY